MKCKESIQNFFLFFWCYRSNWGLVLWHSNLRPWWLKTGWRQTRDAPASVSQRWNNRCIWPCLTSLAFTRDSQQVLWVHSLTSTPNSVTSTPTWCWMTGLSYSLRSVCYWNFCVIIITPYWFVFVTKNQFFPFLYLIYVSFSYSCKFYLIYDVSFKS